MTDQEPKLTKRQELGLRDLLRGEQAGRPYYWMPATMKQLAAFGYAERIGKIAWRLTGSGRARARKLAESLT